MICLDADVFKQCFEDRVFAVFDGSDNTKNLSSFCRELLTEQIKDWPELRKGYESLKGIRMKDLQCNGFSVRIQHNHGRIKSTTAVVDSSHINNRPCFLCLNNLPKAQKGIFYRNTYMILCNPAPVFPSHLTISHTEHLPQSIGEHIDDFILLAADLGQKWTVLYNGPQCGASAPDHFHFQSIPSGFLPVEKEILDEKNLLKVKISDGVQILMAKNLGREAIILKGGDAMAIANALRVLLADLKKILRVDGEPMINMAVFRKKGKFYLIVFPRAKHRPDVFFKEGDCQIMVSPATVEMCGIVIAPLEKDFERLDASIVENIYREVSLKPVTLKKYYSLFRDTPIPS